MACLSKTVVKFSRSETRRGRLGGDWRGARRRRLGRVRNLAAEGQQAVGIGIVGAADSLVNVNGHHVGRIEFGLDDAGRLVLVVVPQRVGQIDLQALGELLLALLVARVEFGPQGEVRERSRADENRRHQQEKKKIELEAHTNSSYLPNATGLCAVFAGPVRQPVLQLPSGPYPEDGR